MNKRVRLSLVFANFADHFSNASEARQRFAIASLCIIAVKQTNFQDENVALALKLLCDHDDEIDFRNKLKLTSESLDEKYFSLY